MCKNNIFFWMGQIFVEKLIDKWGRQRQEKGRRKGDWDVDWDGDREEDREEDRVGDWEAGNTIYSWLLFLPFVPAFYSSLLFHPSPAEEAQQKDDAAETEFDAHGGPDALEAERGG